MNIEVFSIYNAILAALRPSEREYNVIDYMILNALNKALKPLSFNMLHKSSFMPGTHYFNSRYYKALGRLEKRGYVKVTFTKHAGWRKWSITNQGKLALSRMNKRALEYYNKEGSQD